MVSQHASPAPLAATAAEEKQPHDEESEDDEEAESEERAASSSPPQQADDDDNDDEESASFTTLLFSDRGTRLPYWTVETDVSFNESLRERALLPTWKPECQPTVCSANLLRSSNHPCITERNSFHLF
jgi:hypothetical protein